MPFAIEKPRMVWLPNGEKYILKICLFVSTECTNVTDGQTLHYDIGHAGIASHGKK